ncbi:DUF3124 domain-containing protein [Salidesulfovibrio onnuriiensis]|uniref:DUF3124 domain-containing protein n=1 Tax=Salidesulfovibrio onnuriiensis TaxID=2583823 RepID=UPI0011C79315|nr:DUF3124 domain-containing protein [Salidesulfovibrio onnuriiensis]
MLKKILIAIFAILLNAAPLAAESVKLSQGQDVYVPVYSHIYQGIKGKPYNLSALLSIRNTDPSNTIKVTLVRYYDSDGILVKNHLEKPIIVQPLGTAEFYIPERDNSGGSGANFLVHWKGDMVVNAPVIQAVMIGTASTQGISFVCEGWVISEDK